MESLRSAPVLSIQAFRRMPYYLQYLRQLQKDGAAAVSAPQAAEHFGFTEAQVRKDFASVSSARGRPKQGFELARLIRDIEAVLGYHNADHAVLVGVGSLGRSFLQYGGFATYGIAIDMAFDADPNLAGQSVCDVPVFPGERISELCRRMKIPIGIITVPANQAQVVCDQLIAGGVQALWNFAPVHLHVPDGILVQNENLAASLALLSRRLRERETAGSEYGAQRP